MDIIHPHFGMHVNDLERSVSHYERVLGRTFRRIDAESAELRVEGVPFWLDQVSDEVFAEEGFQPPSAVGFGFKVPDLDAAAGHLDANEVAYERRHGYLAIEDPDGYWSTLTEF